MSTAQPTNPPLGLPAGWKAAWSDQYSEWFYVNLHTNEATWDEPTDAAVPPYNPAKVVANVESHPVPSGGPGQADQDSALPTYADARESRRQNDLAYEMEILADYDFEDKAALADTSVTHLTARSKKNSSRVLVKRYSKSDKKRVAAVQRELDALYILGGNDPAIPALVDYFDPAKTVFVISEARQNESLKQYIEGRGPISGDVLKSVMTQLMGALSNIFSNGFAHLRMCDESLFLDEHGQLTIRDFEYAVSYGKEKTDTLYAAVGHEVKGVDGIWRAPEVFAAEASGVPYNGRKAVIWSCGVVLYYMVTGQLDKLSNLDHPVFAGRRPSHSRGPSHAVKDNAVTHSAPAETNIGGAGPGAPTTSTDKSTTTTTTVNQTGPEEPSSTRRHSLREAFGGFRRRSSAATPSSTSYAGPSSSAQQHTRKSSITPSIPTPHTLISYPGNRLDYPSYARDIISKMLILNPYDRAELIEVAAKVPKEFVAKSTRPLMELAWQDYKTHVGPYAGMGLGADMPDGDFRDGAESEYADSVYSGFSGFFGKKR